MSKAPILVADIGGTHARFAYAQAYADRPGHAMTLKVAEFDTPLSAAQRYLTQLSETLGQQYQAPRQAAFAVAASVLGDTVSFTNSHWKFSCAELQQSLELERFFALNDFEALAYALPQLSPSQVRVWGDHSLNRTGNLAVLGPGTGLGVAALVKTRAGWQALPAEGGHASLAPNDDFESEVLRLLRKVYGHVSAERLLSGLGLPLLHQSILQVRGHEAPEITTEHLIRDGLESDPKAMETLARRLCWKCCINLRRTRRRLHWRRHRTQAGGFFLRFEVSRTVSGKGAVCLLFGKDTRCGHLRFRSCTSRGNAGSALSALSWQISMPTRIPNVVPVPVRTLNHCRMAVRGTLSHRMI
jgi:glucokinase